MATSILIVALFFYIFALFGLVLHSFFFVYILFIYFKYRQKPPVPKRRFTNEELPYQLIQLPIYNENLSIVQQLVESACRVSYPRERLIVQLLDDSDIESISARIRALIAGFQKHQPELALVYIQRKKRTGFKGGNLNNGMTRAKPLLEKMGADDPDHIIVSVFDADFIIPPGYLLETVHHFTDTEVGAVQATLGYYNYDTNSFTRAQANFLINLHLIEFGSRSWGSHLTTYRGSAGSWRLSVIENLGGWQSDTQIEDADLSFAAQLDGWKILYLERVIAFCQLPASYNDFKLQQRSWMKGLMEVFRKWGGSIVTSPRLSLGQKILAMDFFLILSLQSLFMIIIHLSIIPSYYYLLSLGSAEWIGWSLLGLLVLLSATHLSFLSTRLKANPEGAKTSSSSWWHSFQDRCISLALIPVLFVTLSYGLIEGLLGRQVHRDRTIKLDPFGADRHPEPTISQQKILIRINRLEIVMSFYSIFLAAWAIWQKEWLVCFTCAILTVGYTWNAVISSSRIWSFRR